MAPILFAALSLSAGAKDPVTLNDLDGVATGKTVIGTTLSISADGSRLAIEHGDRLWVVDVNTGRIARDLGEGLVPMFSPSGDYLAFYSNRSGTLQLWGWNPGAPEVEQLTDLRDGIDADPSTRVAGVATDALRFAFSPDASRIVFASRVAQPKPDDTVACAPLILTNFTSPKLTLFKVFTESSTDDGVPEIKDGRTWEYRAAKKGELLFSQLFVVDTRTRAVMQITHAARSHFHPDWAPDGRTIGFAATGTTAGDEHNDGSAGTSLDDSSKSGEIIVLDLAAKKQRILATGNGVKYRPRWSPNGSEIAYLVSPTTYENPEINVRGFTDGREQAGLQLDRKIGDFDWVGRDEFLVSYYDGVPRLSRFHTGSHSVSNVDRDAAQRAGVWSHTHNGQIAWAEEWDGAHFWVLPRGAKKPFQVIDVATTNEQLDLGRVHTITWRTRRGDTMEGKILYPPEYRPGRRYAVIVDAYPLGGGNTWMHPMEGNQTWAAAGYVVFKPMPRAPHVWMNCSRSANFCRASKGPGAWDVMVDDVMAGVDEAVRRGIVDPDRMCVYGHSNGATTVNYLVTRTNRFKCAVSVASSLSDWMSPVFLNSQDWVSEIVGEVPWQDPTAYIALSAVFHVDSVKTPMLLAVGDRDGAFLLDTIRMYNALRRAGAEVTLLRYPGQGHLFTGAAMRDFWEREMTFFGKYLKDSHSDDVLRH